MTALRRKAGAGWLPWLLLAVVLVSALVVGGRKGSGPESAGARVQRISKELRCPTCRSQSAAESDAAAARAVRAEVERRVRAGQSDAEIRSYFVQSYGKDILLRPEGQGVAALVWVLPVLGLVCALTGLGAAFWRWRPRREPVSAEDRALVEEALRE